MPSDPAAAPARISLGTSGLDAILAGGLTPGRSYLIEGAPGSGKTTLALRFLLEGRARGERGLYVTLSETEEELFEVAASHGWSLEGIGLFELAAAEAALGADRETTLLHPWEVELSETVGLITAEAERLGAGRVVFDSLSEMRLLAQDPLRFRRQVIALKRFFAARAATVLLLEDHTATGGEPDLQLHSLCHGVISLDRMTLDFGIARRRLEVTKMRGAAYPEGWHDYAIRRGGLEVFPRISAAAETYVPFAGEPVSSGLPELDALLGGGPLRGTSTLISGPAGVGKSTIAVQYIRAAAERGERCAIYEFDERTGTLLARSEKIGIDLRPHIEAGLVTLRQIDPAELSPGEFAHLLRRDATEHQTRLILIDSLDGYLTSMPQEKQLVLQLHELLSFLNQRGVLTLLISPQAGLLGNTPSDLNVSYIADNVLLLRYFEAQGRVRKAVSVIKNRGGAHEDTIRELRIDSGGVRVGEVLSAFRGVLGGTPIYTGDTRPLLEGRDPVGA